MFHILFNVSCLDVGAEAAVVTHQPAEDVGRDERHEGAYGGDVAHDERGDNLAQRVEVAGVVALEAFDPGGEALLRSRGGCRQISLGLSLSCCLVCLILANGYPS